MAPKRKSTGKAEAAEPAAKPATKKAKAGALAVGDEVPDLELLREDEETVQLRVRRPPPPVAACRRARAHRAAAGRSLQDLFKERGGVIFMYPRANTGAHFHWTGLR